MSYGSADLDDVVSNLFRAVEADSDDDDDTDVSWLVGDETPPTPTTATTDAYGPYSGTTDPYATEPYSDDTISSETPASSASTGPLDHLLVGRDGRDGRDGHDGRDGRDGHDGRDTTAVLDAILFGSAWGTEVVIDDVEWLTRPLRASTIVLTSQAVLRTNGYPIYAADRLVLHAGAVIDANGASSVLNDAASGGRDAQAGAFGQRVTSGGGGRPRSTADVMATRDGDVAGDDGGSWLGTTSGADEYGTPATGAGGAGGDVADTCTTGGNGGAHQSDKDPMCLDAMLDLLGGTQLSGGAGGGSGALSLRGDCPAEAVAYSGRGGRGGGVVRIVARYVVVERDGPDDEPAVIDARGEDGGDAQVAQVNEPQVIGAGGGGGGGGGSIVVITKSILSPNDVVFCTDGGSGGRPRGSGAMGSSGASGQHVVFTV
jgi:hypothetical protein